MKWTFRSVVALLLLWGIYYVSPFVGLYQLGQAVSHRHAAALSARLDLDEVRKSVSRQLITAYLKATGRESELARSSSQLTAQVGAWMVDPIVAEYVSPERILGLLGNAPPEGAPSVGVGDLGLGSIADAWDLFWGTERRGFTKVVFNLPLRQPHEARYGLMFRLSDFTWKLYGVDLPAALEQRIVREMMKKPLGT
jgi:hypothetical protein